MVLSEKCRFKQVTSCVLCGKHVGSAEALFTLNTNQMLLKCSNCDLIFNSHCLEDIEVIYDEDYYESNVKESTGGYFGYAAMEPALKRFYAFATEFINKQRKQRKKEVSLLDVGCGYGFFLKQFLNNSRMELVGIEPSDKAANEAAKVILNIVRKPIDRVIFDRQFDFITAFEVIEHLVDPTILFEKVKSILQDDGYLLITTPNIGSSWFKLLGKKWPGIHPHFHNVYFSSETIARLAEKCGFEVVKIRQKSFQYMTVQHFRRRMKELFPLGGRLLGALKMFDSVVIPSLNGGSLQVILRKSNPPSNLL